MLFVFGSIKVGLMVGIGGGVPTSNQDIRLGDIVVSQPTDTNGGVIQYDYGKTLSGDRFLRKGSQNKPPGVLLSALESLKAKHERESNKICEFLDEMMRKYPKMKGKVRESRCILGPII